MFCSKTLKGKYVNQHSDASHICQRDLSGLCFIYIYVSNFIDIAKYRKLVLLIDLYLKLFDRMVSSNYGCDVL